ncbi:PREDICTED: solute carrier family 2, facilitated glucose transporter member 5-like, partial [Thamnophis sirtalis]|uniref:Solute carrier family 2, facilitated glucose transporter member 5-like n=1 Tax=Thamnophis sirtalis TaxID=35019 RepID=A0A6I9Z240_9SAUR
FMQQFYNETYQGRYSKYMDESLMTALWSLSVSFFPLGGFFGSLMVGPMVNNCGRKGTLLINNIFSIIPAILMGISKVAKTFEVIIICRIIIGICAGETSALRHEGQPRPF